MEVQKMISGSATLVIDLGNSSSKCKVLFGKDAKTKLFKYRQFELLNVFASIENNYAISSDYNPITSLVLDIDTSKDNPELLAGVATGHYCVGDLQTREFPLTGMKPTATQHKWELPTTPLSLRYAFFQAARSILAMNNTTDFSQLDVTWKVIALLPPGDVAIGQQVIKDMIKNINEVRCVFPDVSIPVKVEKCTVLPEGYCAYVGVVYDEGQTFREECRYLTEETVLVYDIGAGTTDCLVIKDNKLVQNSKFTIQLGGNNVFQEVRQALRLNGLNISNENIEQGIVKGFVKDGAKKVSIVDEINKARQTAAIKINNEFQGYIEGTDLKIKDISFVIVCGGGALENTKNPDIHPLSAKIIENLKTLSPNVELVELPMHKVIKEKADGGVEKIEERINPRELNLIGASILAEAL